METEAGVMILVRYGGLLPELGITIQRNVGVLRAPARSIITVRKRR